MGDINVYSPRKLVKWVDGVQSELEKASPVLGESSVYSGVLLNFLIRDNTAISQPLEILAINGSKLHPSVSIAIRHMKVPNSKYDSSLGGWLCCQD
jgi:hypothetical protein